MSPEQINRFFRTLAKELPHPTTIILTGAAAGSLLGHVRASADVDFAILTGSDDAARWQQVEAAIARVELLTKIQAQYAEDIDRWSSVSLLDYRRHTRRYRRFGSLDVRILDPSYWAIGKLSRYLPQDRADLVAVFSRHRLSPESLVRLWARALRASPRSLALTQFRDHIEDFLRSDGVRIWGRTFDAEATIQRFRRALASGSTT
jgi:hypothetical protein